MADWQSFCESIKGVNKQRNQDSCVAEGTGLAEYPLILAVADGHGSASHGLSHIGARLAVDLFVARAREFTASARNASTGDPRTLRRLMNYARHDMPRRLVGDWRREALAHWARQADPAEPEPPVEERIVLYGTTLIGAVLTPELFAAWQLGDGDLTVVESDGEIRRPLAPAEPDLGDETDSLCEPDAWQLVRVHWAPVFDRERAPRLIVLSTDGLSKSFASDDGFARFVGGLDERLSGDGPDSVRAALPEWLAEASRHSGDDTTLAAGQRPPNRRVMEET